MGAVARRETGAALDGRAVDRRGEGQGCMER